MSVCPGRTKHQTEIDPPDSRRFNRRSALPRSSLRMS
jgi:hypothetical protein